MVKQNQTVEDKQDIKRRRKAKPGTGELVDDRVGLAKVTNGLLGVTSGSAETQTAWLNDTRLQTAQRQVSIAQIGQFDGNRYLSKVIMQTKQNKPQASRLSVQQQNAVHTIQQSNTVQLEQDPKKSAETPATEPPTTEAESTKPLSGSSWVAQFPNSTSLDDLESTFGGNVIKFKKAIEDAGGTISVSSTKRPSERAYLMHWAWLIAKNDQDAQTIPEKAGVDINWWHGDAAKSKKAAQEMVTAYGISSKLKVAPSLTSRHIQGKAIDMSVSWSGDLEIKQADGTEQVIKSTPKDATNTELIQVGKTFSVIHFTNVSKDPNHWSTDGK